MGKLGFAGPLGIMPYAVAVIILIWSVFWKGLALWRSARSSRKYWFIVLLVINTIGILDIIYLAFFQKNKLNIGPIINKIRPSKKLKK